MSDPNPGTVNLHVNSEKLASTIKMLGLRIGERFPGSGLLRVCNDLYAIAHVIDMHQLTKDPSSILRVGPTTIHSPKREMSQFELNRYLDYCAEMVSLVSKVGFVYVQNFPDPPGGQLGAFRRSSDMTTSESPWQRPGPIFAKEVCHKDRTFLGRKVLSSPLDVQNEFRYFGNFSAACAAASRAIGTRKGEHET